MIPGTKCGTQYEGNLCQRWQRSFKAVRAPGARLLLRVKREAVLSPAGWALKTADSDDHQHRSEGPFTATAF